MTSSTPRDVYILLVDDQPANLIVLEAILDDLGVEFVRATSGEEALRCMDEHEFAMVLLDVRMPEMDGFETARHLRARAPSTPIIFLTADDPRRSDLDDAYALGAVDFLYKPLDATALRSKVNVFVELYQARLEARAERRFRDSERRVRLASEAAGIGFWSWISSQDDIFLENARAHEILGIPVEDACVTLARFIACLSSDQAKRDFCEALAQCVRDTDPLHFEGECKLAGCDEPRWLVFQARCHMFEEGADRQVIGTVLDDSARKRTEEELRESNKRKSDFIAALSHELRTPLGTLNNGLHLLGRVKAEDTVAARTREMMQRQLNQMTRLVDDLLDVRRIGSGNIELRQEDVLFAEIVEAAIDSSKPLIEASHHTLDVRLPQEPVRLWADPARLIQVLANLLNNAAKYTPAGGKIDLEVTHDGAILTVEVRDNGIGIAANDLDHVFDMFAQVSRDEKFTRGGLGIGLALVRQLVRLHGGEVKAHSDGAGAGSRFVVRLPLAENVKLMHSR